MVDNNSAVDNTSETNFEEKVVEYIKSLAAIEASHGALQGAEASTQG